MKRFATILFAIAAFGVVASTSSAQTQRTSLHRGTAPTITAPATAGQMIAPIYSPLTGKGATPQAVVTRAVSYFQDTTGGNAWLYTPILDAGPDSLYSLRFNPNEYFQVLDTIGNVDVGLGNGQTVTVFDTMYYRVFGERVSTPADIKSARIDSVVITFAAYAMDPADSIQVWVVPIQDVAFSRNNVPIGNYPIPNLFGTAFAKGSIKASQVTVGQLNTVTVPLGHRSIGAAKHFAVCVFVDGPNFPTDQIGYQLDANLQTSIPNADIDTDGTLQTYGGIPMRTYRVSLDAGNQVLNGQKSYIGGGGGFFGVFPEFDQTGNPTGQDYVGNLVMVTYLSGTALSVEKNPVPGYSLGDVFPNPVANRAEIDYTLGQSGPVTLTLHNSLGQEISRLVDHVEGAGAHTFELNASKLANGMYYYTLQSGEYSATGNVVVNR